MAPRDIGAWLMRRWPIVGGALLLAAFVVALALDLPGSRGILAQDDPTPVVITEETMHLLPPFDLNAIPTIAQPPCMEELERKYGRYFNLGYGRNGNCSIRVDGRYLTESQADALIVKREAEESKRARAARSAYDAAMQARLAARTIELRDGRTIKLPSDVRIVEIRGSLIQCVTGWFCPQTPFYKLVRGQSVVWTDANGVAFSFDGDDIDPDARRFLTTERAPGR